MTVTDLIKIQLATSGNQLTKVFEGMPENLFEEKLVPSAMSPADTLIHLSECYVASKAAMSGEKHEWGTFTIEDRSPANLLAVHKSLRDQACEAALAQPDHVDHAFDFIVLHDCYHIGQMAQFRLANTPDWNPYSLYEG